MVGDFSKGMINLNKRVFFYSLLLILIIIGLTLSFLFAIKEKEKEMLKENQTWVEKRALSLEMEYKDNEKILNFIEKSLPKKVMSKNFPYYIRDHFKEKKVPDDVLQETLFAELQYAIKERNVEILSTIFEVDTFLEFVNQFENYDELIAAQNKLMNNIDKSGSFESISYIRKDDRQFIVMFNYKSGAPIKLDMKIKRNIVDGTKNEYYYAISSSYIDFYEAFNKSTKQ